jgi:UDP-N-acetylmuramoyl-tripeptide--D-alanyl-D-alanine ligase
MVFDLATVLESTHGRVARGRAGGGTVFRAGCFDSRATSRDCLFFALKGERDGHDFVADALARGASGAVVARIPEDAPQEALLLLVADPLRALRDLADALRDRHPIPAGGVTGSVGKTTTKEAAAAALGARYRVLRSPASFNNEIGVPITFLAQEPTHEVAVVEMGFYVPGEIADLCRLVRPQVGVVTAVPDRPPHFSRTPSVEAIARGKAELVEAIPADGIALLNADDARARAMAEHTRARVVLYGTAPDAALRATDIDLQGLEGTRFVARYGRDSAEVRFPLPGAHLVTSALAGVGLAVALGVPLEEAAIGVATLERPAHRMSVRRVDSVTVIDDTYNASPAAVSAALQLLAAQRARRVAVLGDMLELGSLAQVAHREVGQLAAQSADVLIGVGELAAVAVHEAKRVGLREAHSAVDNAEALVLLRRTLSAGDVVLVKGSRALRMEEIVDALVASRLAASP